MKPVRCFRNSLWSTVTMAYRVAEQIDIDYFRRVSSPFNGRLVNSVPSEHKIIDRNDAPRDQSAATAIKVLYG